MTDAMWEGFADAIVRLYLDDGDQILRPDEPGRVGHFPFDEPVHIVTAYNPGGMENSVAANRGFHTDLCAAVNSHRSIPSTGSSPSGEFAEPGLAILDISLDDATELGRTFGQRAIYRWTTHALRIVGVDEDIEVVRGWTLSPAD